MEQLTSIASGPTSSHRASKATALARSFALRLAAKAPVQRVVVLWAIILLLMFATGFATASRLLRVRRRTHIHGTDSRPTSEPDEPHGASNSQRTDSIQVALRVKDCQSGRAGGWSSVGESARVRVDGSRVRALPRPACDGWDKQTHLGRRLGLAVTTRCRRRGTSRSARAVSAARPPVVTYAPTDRSLDDGDDLLVAVEDADRPVDRRLVGRSPGARDASVVERGGRRRVRAPKEARQRETGVERVVVRGPQQMRQVSDKNDPAQTQRDGPQTLSVGAHDAQYARADAQTRSDASQGQELGCDEKRSSGVQDALRVDRRSEASQTLCAGDRRVPGKDGRANAA